MEVKYIEELRLGLVAELEAMKSAEDRKAMLEAIGEYVKMLERKQQLRLVVRESFYRVAYHVFNYLRRNRQLGRETMPFDRDIKSRLEQVLSKLLVEYGAGKD